MNLDLPSHRRILFLLLFALFLLIGFGTRYLLIEMGWVDDESIFSSTAEPRMESPPASAEENEPSSTGITEEDRREAKDVAVRFVKAYLEAEKRAFFREVGPWMTRELQAKFEADSEKLPGPLPVQSVEATRIEDYELERNGKVAWDVWVSLKDQKQHYEVTYQVMLNKNEGSWKVEEVALVEYPEYPD